MVNKLKVAVIGGGAAGFYAAICVKENFPTATVTLFEKTSKVLAKVAISGGGRCNVTNGHTSIKTLSEGYPRGSRLMKKALQVFSTRDIMKWFEDRGVPLKTESDNRVFPISDNSQSITDCLVDETRKLNIEVIKSSAVRAIQPADHSIDLEFDSRSITFDKVIVASGGSPKETGLSWLAVLGHDIVYPVPSLFTFNMPGEKITSLMGVVAPMTKVSIQGTKLKATGPLLITHWGMSGPAILKLSAFGARLLFDAHYKFIVQVNWVDVQNNEAVREVLVALSSANPKKILSNTRPFNLPVRLWTFLIRKSEIDPGMQWINVGKKHLNKLVSTLTNDIYNVNGKTTFKEEFVTCGGISLGSIHEDTMQSRSCRGLYFAGEVLDIDGITGGYNFQAAWTTAYLAGQLR